jgi:hypothetical protein
MTVRAWPLAVALQRIETLLVIPFHTAPLPAELRHHRAPVIPSRSFQSDLFLTVEPE